MPLTIGFRRRADCRNLFRIFAPGGPANVDNRLSNNSEDRLVAALRGIQLNDESLPVRPDFGTVGKVIKLRTNFFPVTPPKQDIYDYDVAISPACTFVFIGSAQIGADHIVSYQPTIDGSRDEYSTSQRRPKPGQTLE